MPYLSSLLLAAPNTTLAIVNPAQHAVKAVAGLLCGLHHKITLNNEL